MKRLLALVAIALFLPSLASKGDNLRSAGSRWREGILPCDVILSAAFFA